MLVDQVFWSIGCCAADPGPQHFRIILVTKIILFECSFDDASFGVGERVTEKAGIRGDALAVCDINQI
jgi:hypothetical protein